MNVAVKASNCQGQIDAIVSKSYAHRIAICSYFSGEEIFESYNGFSSDDIKVTAKCLKAVSRGERKLDCNESGSTLRFLIPFCASLGGEFELTGSKRLMERPNDELIKCLSDHGVRIESGNSIFIKGKLTSGKYKIRGDISSQYVSGLLMALPTLDGDSKIELTTPLASAPYVDITLQVLEEFGVKVDRTENGFIILGNQKYKGSILPEGDWSNAAFFLTYAAISGKVIMNGLNANSVQGDRYILDILKKAGAKVIVNENSIEVQKRELNAFTFDAENCPDLVPIASVLAGCAKGDSVIKNISRLKIKESDRVQAIIDLLGTFGICARSDGENLYIKGGKPKSASVDSFNDHRMVMSASVLAGVCGGESVIYNAQAVNKSYPTFFEDYRKLGGVTYEV